MWLDILLSGVKNWITGLVFLIALFGPVLFNRNWMFIEKDAGWHHRQQPTAYDDLPEPVLLQDNSWHFAFQDHAIQLYTLFLVWVALLLKGATTYFNIVAKQSWDEFSALFDTLHWSIAWSSSGVWWILLACFFVGAFFFLSGTFSKIDIVARYKYEKEPDLLGFHFAPWASPLTICRIIIWLMALFFSIYVEFINTMAELVE